MPTGATSDQLAELFWALPTHLDPEAIAARVAEALARLLNAPLVGLWRFEPEGPRCLGAAGLTPKKCASFAQALGLAGTHEGDAPRRESALSFGKRRLGAAAVIPWAQGALGIARYDKAPFTDLELEMTSLVIARVGTALEAAHLHQAIAQQRRELQLNVELARIASAPGELEPMVRAFSERVGTSLDLSIVGIALAEDAGSELPLKATYAADPARAAALEALFARAPLNAGADLTGAVLKANRLMILEDVAQEPLLRPETREFLGDGSLAAVPLVARGRAVGVMYWHRAARSGPFPPSERELMTQLGAWLGLAIDHARLVAREGAAK